MVNFLEQLLEKVMGPRLEVTLDPQDVLVERRGVVWNVDGSMRSCEFCNTASGVGEEQAKLVYEDDLVVAFAPLKSAAKQHFLVVPRKHIAHVGDLFADDLNILNRMKTAGQELLKKGSANLAAEDMQFSFHVPPWNSIEHLHLHVIELPFNSMVDRIKFAEGKPWCAAYDKVHTWVSASPDQRDDEDDERPVPIVHGRSPVIGEQKKQTSVLVEEAKDTLPPV